MFEPRIASDEDSAKGKGRVADAWLKAAGKIGIPATFLIDHKGHMPGSATR